MADRGRPRHGPPEVDRPAAGTTGEAPGGAGPAGAPRAGRGPVRPGSARARAARSGRGRAPSPPGRGWRGTARRHPVRAVLGSVGVVVLLLVVAAVAWYEVEATASGRGPRTIVTVRPGASLDAVTATLAREQVLSSSLAFRVYLLLHGSPLVRPGAYLLHRSESFAAVRATLAGGPDVFPVTVYPGFTARELAQEVDDVPGHDGAHFLSLVTTGAVRSPYEPAGSDTIDGLLGTGVYQVLPGESDQALLGDMIDRFDAVAHQAGLVAGAAALHVTPYQAITVASIVEKEGVYRENLGKVSRVIYNRLARGTPLQMDSTVLYSEQRDGGPVTPADLALDTPYNTYLHAGLTPTPICFPSPASLRAALAPTPGDWLYFVVVTKDGTEAFSDTLAGQLANENLAKSRGLG